jgi:hypothetical protein
MTATDLALCGRPTVKKRPCRMQRVIISQARFGVSSPCHFGVSCARHMTTEELAAYRQAIEANAIPWNKIQPDSNYVPLRDRDPACWSWEVISTDDLCEFCDGRCGICGATPAQLVMDHDHATGLERGMLCRSCNTREGFASNEESVWTRYRVRNPATILGVEERYWSPFTGEDIGEDARWANYNIGSSPAYAVAAVFAPSPAKPQYKWPIR